MIKQSNYKMIMKHKNNNYKKNQKINKTKYKNKYLKKNNNYKHN